MSGQQGAVKARPGMMGAIMMALGGLVSLSDRRYRVAAGARSSTPARAVPAE